MREHIGGHLLRGEIEGPNVCGFCGRDTCTIEVQSTSKKGSWNYYKICNQDCSYFFDYGRKAVGSIRDPCTNRVVICPVDTCHSTIWTYNTSSHFDVKHPF